MNKASLSNHPNGTVLIILQCVLLHRTEYIHKFTWAVYFLKSAADLFYSIISFVLFNHIISDSLEMMCECVPPDHHAEAATSDISGTERVPWTGPRTDQPSL